jgi:hypothetical protein
MLQEAATTIFRSVIYEWDYQDLLMACLRRGHPRNLPGLVLMKRVIQASLILAGLIHFLPVRTIRIFRRSPSRMPSIYNGGNFAETSR